jgi:peptidoglycan/LPS O-acetylase OafA/YrhL
VLAAVYVLVITGAADADVRGRWSPWRSRPMVRLGEISFAYYLVHVFLITTVLRLTGHAGGLPGWQGLAATAGFLLVCLLLAWLLFRFVETPMMRLLGPRRRLPNPAADPGSGGPDAAGPGPGGADPGGSDTSGLETPGSGRIPAPRLPGDAQPVGRPDQIPVR